jgi:hypothetical protein
MHRLVESPISFLCIPSGMHPSMTSLSRFAAPQQTVAGMHSAGMQQEGAGAIFYRAMHPSGMPRCRGFFAGLSLAGTKCSGAARSVRVSAAAVCSVSVRIASRRDASPGSTMHRLPLHSVRNASFDDLALPFCSALTSHGGDAFRRNATGGCGRFFYRAMHPSGMQRCRGFFLGLSLRVLIFFE